MCDGDDYGRFLAYKFPKEKRVLGPQQVETKIDQDSHLSAQLTLWDQRGSNVIRGNVLAIPVEGTLFYVEPIYLKAKTAAYPELRLVVVMHEDNLSYAETFEEALAGLFGERTAPPPEPAEAEEPAEAAESNAGFDELAREAQDAFDDYLERQADRDFEGSAEALRRLEQALERMVPSAGQGTVDENEN
jgi:hypothetical protein